MVHNCVLLNAESEPIPSSIVSGKSFSVREISWITDQLSNERLYQQIVCKIVTKPEQLILHLQRIYVCYSHGLAKTLYAALVDLLLVLEGKGKLLSKRMILSSRSVLTVHQFSVLVNNLKSQALQC